MGVQEDEAHQRLRAFFRMDRYILRELAQLWKPDVPVSQNDAYMDRARELNRELETELMSSFKGAEGAEGDEPPDESGAYRG